MRRATRIVSAAFQGVVVAAALGTAAFLVVPKLLGWKTVTVMSGSMSPTYAVDAVLAVDPVDPAKIRVDDVIVFRTEADRPLVTHRVVAVEHRADGLMFVTKGDANEDADRDPVAASAVRGRVVFGIPYLGAFIRAIHNPVGFAALFVLPGIILICQEILAIRREIRDRRARKHSSTIWAPPLAANIVARPEIFDFWTTVATEDRYYDELERLVHR
jgi:signal peptidase I